MRGLSQEADSEAVTTTKKASITNHLTPPDVGTLDVEDRSYNESSPEDPSTTTAHPELPTTTQSHLTLTLPDTKITTLLVVLDKRGGDSAGRSYK